MQYAYHNQGQMPGTGAGDKRALGSLGGSTTLDRPTLPVPGAPEVMAGMGNCGCGCKGAGTCGMGAFSASDPTTLVVLGVGAYFLYKHLKKRR